MRADRDPELSLNEWIVLTLVDEGQTHGFAVATVTAPEGFVGRVWHVPRPLVYRAIARLTDTGMLTERGMEPGRGPRRMVVASTPKGHAAAERWLREPVLHVRDIRSHLLVKLALLARRERDPASLLTAQRAALAPIIISLERRRDEATGFDRTLAVWRSESVQATRRFIDQLSAPAVRNVPGTEAGQAGP
jgi:DNA-binding PadR family transcriptional regulator